jgi:tetratricopeptide (TPR) repeat protein
VKRHAAPLLVVAAMASCLAYVDSASALATKQSLALASGAIALAASLSFSRALPRANRAWLAGVAYVAWTAFSALWGAEGALLGLGVTVASAALGSASATLGCERARWVATRSALLVGAVLTLGVLASFVAGRRGFALHAGQGNPNWTGLVLAVAWPLAITDALVARASTALRVLLSASFAVALIVTGSRAGAVAGVVGCAIVILGGAARRLRLVWATAAVILASLAVVTLSSAFGTGPAGVTSATDAETSLRGRLFIHRVSAEAALEHLPLGVGLGRFHAAFLARQGRELAELAPAEAAQRFENATTAHQDFLQTVLEAGPIALIFLGAALALAFHQHFRTGFHGGAGALAAAATAALADSPFRETTAPILLALVFAALPAGAGTATPRTRYAWVLLELALLAAVSTLLPKSFGAFAASQARQRALDAEPRERRALLLRAVELDPTNAAAVLELGTARHELGDRDGALRDFERAERLAPDLATAVALGNTLLESDRPSEARASFERAVALHPGSFRARVGFAETLRRLGRFTDAETQASIAVRLLPGDARARTLLDAIREQRADHELGLP